MQLSSVWFQSSHSFHYMDSSLYSPELSGTSLACHNYLFKWREEWMDDWKKSEALWTMLIWQIELLIYLQRL